MAYMTAISEYKTILKTFSRALSREAHVLTQHPDLLWQQLYNRLQWEGKEIKLVLAQELAWRSIVGARPWFHLKTPFRESKALVRTLTGHTRHIPACAVSPNGTWIVSASADNNLKVWDATTGQELHTMTGHTSWVQGCAVTPDNKRIISACVKSLKIWDAASGQELRTIQTGNTDWSMGNTVFCAVSPDGTWIVSGSEDRNEDKTLKIWDMASGQELHTLTGHTGWPRSCAVSPDGSWIVSASVDKTLRIWDTASGQELRILTGHTGKVEACAISPDGSWIVSASSDNTLKIWDAASGRELRTLTGHTDEVQRCAVSPDGLWIVSASLDKTIRIWDAASGQRAAKACRPHKRG